MDKLKDPEIRKNKDKVRARHCRARLVGVTLGGVVLFLNVFDVAFFWIDRVFVEGVRAWRPDPALLFGCRTCSIDPVCSYRPFRLAIPTGPDWSWVGTYCRHASLHRLVTVAAAGPCQLNGANGIDETIVVETGAWT